MNNKVDPETRIEFRDALRAELRRLDFYQRRGDHYLIREFAKYCVGQEEGLRKAWSEFTFPEKFFTIDEASLGRYLRDEEPVLPTPARVRALALILGLKPAYLMALAGYRDEFDDLEPRPIPDATATPTPQLAGATH